MLTCSANSENNKKLGDVNSDGEINSSDASAILADYANTSAGGTSSLDINTADVNGDGNISIADATTIQKIIAGIE